MYQANKFKAHCDAYQAELEAEHRWDGAWVKITLVALLIIGAVA